MDKRIYTSQLGFTLVEVIVAIGLLSMAVVGPLYFTTNSINTGIASTHQLTAFYLAQEAMEYVKAKRDGNFYDGGNWLNGGDLNKCFGASGCRVDVFANDITGCGGACPVIKLNQVTGRYQYTDGDNTIFTRVVNIDNGSGDEAIVNVTVTWNERMIGTREVKLEEHIFNWYVD